MEPSINTIIVILFVLVMIVVIDTIYRRLKPFIFARRGEVMAAIRLLMLPKDKYKVINAVLLKTNWGNCQIDHIVVSSFGIFVLEIKNYKGTIYGGDNSEKWTQFLQKRKYELVNPIKQNANHIKALKELLKIEVPFYSVIVFNNKAKVKSNAENALLTTQKDLIEDIKRQNTIVLSLEEMEEITDKIKQYNKGSFASVMTHDEKEKVSIKRRVFSVSDESCPECGAKLTKRNSEYGEFLSCSNYPKCNYSHRFIL